MPRQRKKNRQDVGFCQLYRRSYYSGLIKARLKGLGHAILGNFSTDQIVIDGINQNIKITAKNYRKTLTKHGKAKQGHGWTTLERIEMDCTWVSLKNVGPPFFKFTVCQLIHVSKCHSHSYKTIPGYYVAMILQMKDFWSANLTF